MTADSRFIWDGLTLQHRAVLRGTSLEPRRALLRVQQAREKDEVAASDDCSDADLDFEQSLMRIGMTGAFLPYMITGDVRAEATSEGLVVTATTSLGTLLGGLGLSLVTITLFFEWAKPAANKVAALSCKEQNHERYDQHKKWKVHQFHRM